VLPSLLRLCACAAFCATFLTTAVAQEPLASARNANYTLWVRLDPAAKTLDGRGILAWRNDTPAAANELWFHLYWNAWLNSNSTWMREDTLRARPRFGRFPPPEWAYIRVHAMKLLAGPFPEADLTAQMRFAAPDDGNPEDRTVLVVTLPRAVRPGEIIRVEFLWTAKIPRTIARTGYRGNFFFLAHWFPKLGVFQPDGTWNCHQFHSATEFFSDYGVYDVQITVPRGWVVGATGVRLGVTNNPDGTATYRFEQADVHDFAWTTSPDYREATRRFEHPGLKAVEMRLLYQAEHESQVDRHFRATEAALQYYGLWFGEYPYGHVTIIDPAYQSGAGGMEYPTLFTAGTRYWNPFGGGSPEGVTIHEAGHQFWYGLVGNNEFEHAWLDEGLNTFSEARVMSVAYGQPFFVRRFFRGFVPVAARDILMDFSVDLGLDRYRDVARRDIQATPTFRYFPVTASGITYSKTGLWLGTMERMYGWETTRKILSTFFQRGKFRHPKPEDFLAVAQEVSGRDMSPFFDQVFYKAAVFDFAVESVQSREVRTLGYVERGTELVPAEAQPAGETKLYETRVVVRRVHDGILPVEVLLKFENGEEVRELWDGQALWKLYTYVKPARLAYAALDPERKILLDVNYTNNSQRLVWQADLPATKWASKWMIWLQDLMHTLLFFL